MPHLLEIVCNFKLILHIGHVRFHFRIGVIDDGEEHVDENKEDKEDEQHEEYGAQNAVCCFKLIEVKITQDNTEQCEARQ